MNSIAPKQLERRRAPRADVGRYLVRLDAGDGRAPIACVVLDISEIGARLKLSEDIGLPDSVRILVGNVVHLARVVWRESGQIGIEFIEELPAGL